jgi:hypothetical protein
MHDLPIRKQGASCDLGVAKAQILAFAGGRELLYLGLRDLIETAACVPWPGRQRADLPRIDGIKCRALHQLRQQRREGARAVE